MSPVTPIAKLRAALAAYDKAEATALEDFHFQTEERAEDVLKAARELLVTPGVDRFDLEQAARKALGLNEHWTVVFREGPNSKDAPKRAMATQQTILAGKEWTP
jgi:hypothetical protein